MELIYMDGIHVIPAIRDTLLADKVQSSDEALLEIYRKMRPGEPPTIEMARTLFSGMFFNGKRYDLSSVGRLKLNKKLKLDIPIDKTTLTAQDVVEVIRYLVNLRTGKGEVDDIDHLGNRRVRVRGRTSGEPDSGGPRPYGARNQGAHEPAGCGYAYAA